MIDLQAAKNPIVDFLIQDDKILRRSDLAIIENDGMAGWAVGQENLIWEDAPLQWDALPILLRSMIVTDTIESLQMPMRYALPFRHLGRVITFALLPTKTRPIRVKNSRALPSRRPVVKSPPRIIDPPVPFLVMGLATPVLAAMHARIVRGLLGGSQNESFHVSLQQIMVGLAREGKITKSEAFYYMLSMRALASRSWQQIREYFGLMALEHIVEQATLRHPAQAQMLAHAHLIEGRPIEWDEELLDVEIKN